MISDDVIKCIDAAYQLLEAKQREILQGLSCPASEIESGWYNGHYCRKSDDGAWIRDAYPIPVIGVKGLCDMEIQFDRIWVSTKLGRETALRYSYDKLNGYTFEAYGVEGYLKDFYHEGQTWRELLDAISASDEKEIGFSFIFPFEVADGKLRELVEMLRREGFYY